MYRIGQHNSVNVHYLVAQDTADDYIWYVCDTFFTSSFSFLCMIIHRRPMVQRKLRVLNQAGLAVEDFTSSESSSHVHKVRSLWLYSSTSSIYCLLSCDKFNESSIIFSKKFLFYIADKG